MVLNLGHFKATLLPEVFNLLLSNLTNEIAYKIEEQVYKCRFNQVCIMLVLKY